MTKLDFMKPRVFKASDGKWLMIIYNNREETYDLARRNSFKEISKEQGCKYTKNDAIRLCEDMKEVHFTDEIEAYGIVCNCGDIDKSINMGIKGCECKIVDKHEKMVQKINVNFVELEKR